MYHRSQGFRFWFTSVGLSITTLLLIILPQRVEAQTSFIEFESGPVRPLALSPDGTRLFAANIPDNRLEIFSVNAGALAHLDSVPVGMEPVAVAARSNRSARRAADSASG